MNAVLDNETPYLRWREQKLARYPRRAEDLVVEVRGSDRVEAGARAASVREALDKRVARTTDILGWITADHYEGPVYRDGNNRFVYRLDFSFAGKLWRPA